MSENHVAQVTTIENDQKFKETLLWFQQGKRRDYVVLEGFRKGYARLIPSLGTSITEFSEVISDFMSPDSNFVSAVVPAGAKFRGIIMSLNDVSVTVSSHEPPEAIEARWWNKWRR